MEQMEDRHPCIYEGDMENIEFMFFCLLTFQPASLANIFRSNASRLSYVNHTLNVTTLDFIIYWANIPWVSAELVALLPSVNIDAIHHGGLPLCSEMGVCFRAHAQLDTRI